MNSSTYVTQKHGGLNKHKKAKDLKKKYGAQAKKFPELKMMVNGDYRSSNYTMSSDDEVFNVSNLSILLNKCLFIVSTYKEKRLKHIITIEPLKPKRRQCLQQFNSQAD